MQNNKEREIYNANTFFTKADILAGATAGVIQIAPSLANSQQAGLPPINGLYVAFFSSLIYMFLGTSREMSTGTNGIISLMVYSTIQKYEGILYPNELTFNKNASSSYMNMSSEYLSTNPVEVKVMLAGTLCFLVAFFQLFVGFFNIGFIVKYISNVVISGLTCSAAIVIIIGQINSLMDFRVYSDPSIPFKMIENIISIVTNIHTANVATLILSILMISVIYLTNKFVINWFKRKFKVPLPIELIVIIIADLMSYLISFKERFNIQTVGNIPTSMPHFELPFLRLDIMSFLLLDAASIALVSFVLNVAFAKYFSNKNKYSIRYNQESIAYGYANLVLAFFDGFPLSANYTRSLNIDNLGVKTQIFSLVSSMFAFAGIIGIGLIFRTLPKCCLSAIIVASLIDHCLQITSLRVVWRRDKTDGIIWLATFLGVIIFEIKYGLFIGTAVSMITVIVKSQQPHVAVLGNIPETELYEDINYSRTAKELEGIKVIRYEANIYYANTDNFVVRIIKFTNVNVLGSIATIKKKRFAHSKFVQSIEKTTVNDRKKSALLSIAKVEYNKNISEDRLNLEIARVRKSHPLRNVVLDMSCVNFMDTMGVEALLKVKMMLEEAGIGLHLSFVKRSLFLRLENHAFGKRFSYDNIYPSTHDAIRQLLNRQEKEFFDEIKTSF